MKIGLRKILIIGFGIWLILVVYFVFLYTRPCGVGEISVPSNDKDSKIVVGEKLIEQYLKAYKTKGTCPGSWITTYKINSIKSNGLGAQENNEFIVSIDYSVKPIKTNNSFWLNNGDKFDNDGWINNKNIDMKIKRDGSFFKSIIR